MSWPYLSTNHLTVLSITDPKREGMAGSVLPTAANGATERCSVVIGMLPKGEIAGVALLCIGVAHLNIHEFFLCTGPACDGREYAK